jgi:succinate dehydrogenase / fumarate reductase, flavoprotein subunit
MIRKGRELARPLQRSVRDLMWERCGVVRDEAGLTAGLAGLQEIRAAADDVDVRPSAEGWTDLAHALDLRAALVTSEATLRLALERRETRGAHIRPDHPDPDPSFEVSLHVRRDPATGDLVVSREPLPPISAQLSPLIEDAGELTLKNRLLE